LAFLITEIGTNIAVLQLYWTPLFKQAHADGAIPITKKLWFTSRIAYYWKVLTNLRHSCTQLHLGHRF